MTESSDAVTLTNEVRSLVSDRLDDIGSINRQLDFLALNAMLEGARAGEAGRGFSVIAAEVRTVSQQINRLTTMLQDGMEGVVGRMIKHIEEQSSTRLTDLSLNLIEVIDRNLYERTCDVRWWATDSAIVECAEVQTDDAREYASRRLGVILDSYTVYQDILILDLNGNVLANGRPGKFAIKGHNLGHAPWFKALGEIVTGADYVVGEPGSSGTSLGDQVCAVYATAIRQGAKERGVPAGILAVFFDWGSQAETVTRGVRLSADEWVNTRCMLLDASGKVIASSDGKGLFEKTIKIPVSEATGQLRTDGGIIAFARTPGYETYPGMGWYGAIERFV